ncbi:MAG: transcriptional repressor LexA [Vicinamibacteria bacterium]
MPKTPPGETRARVLHYVQERLLEGRPPTIREVQQAFRFRAVETARAHLEALVREGRLSKRDGESRGFELPLPRGASHPRLIPILGRVQAGALSTAVEDLEGYVPFDLRGADEVFALRVRGESMTGAGIFGGDLVLVRRQPSARSGEIVVALVAGKEDEATVKRLRILGRRIELHPENPAFEVIVPKHGECMILGKVIEVRRFLG